MKVAVREGGTREDALVEKNREEVERIKEWRRGQRHRETRRGGSMEV